MRGSPPPGTSGYRHEGLIPDKHLMRPSLAASLLLLAACTPSPSPQPTGTPPAGASASAAPEAQGTEALVWTATKDHPPTTRWIAPTAGGYRRVAETPGLLVAAGPDVWRWSAREEPVKTEACEGSIAKPAGKGSVTRVSLDKLGGSDHVEIVSPKVDRAANAIEHTATPVGSVGPYLFVRQRTTLFPCAAHRSYDVDQAVWDVSKRARVDFLGPEERKVADTTDRAAAQRLFSAEGDKENVPLEDISYAASVPRYLDRGALGIENLFIRSVSHAGSDGVWSSGTKSILVPASQIPTKAKPYAQPPPAVVAYVADHPDEKISGWSTVSKEAAAVLGGALGAH